MNLLFFALLFIVSFLGHKALGSAPLKPLPNHSVILVHTSKHYHTNPQTIAWTNQLVTEKAHQGHLIVGLAAEDILTDPLWYSFREPHLIRDFRSHHGEHFFFPDLRAHLPYEMTALGGYHNSCLGWALSELISRYLKVSSLEQPSELILHLPMTAIYTGFLLTSQGSLQPKSNKEEAQLDSSVDGLNLKQVTEKMSDEQWRQFMMESLQVAIFEKNPISHQSDLQGVIFHLSRDHKKLAQFEIRNSVLSSPARRSSERNPKPRHVHFKYRSF